MQNVPKQNTAIPHTSQESIVVRLNLAKKQLISGFIDTYLQLNAEEKVVFDAAIEEVDPEVQGDVMKIVTSWQLEGRIEGREEGRQSQIELVTFLLANQLGQIPSLLEHQIQGLELFQLKQLGKQSLEMNTMNELASRLNELEALEGFEDDKADVLIN